MVPLTGASKPASSAPVASESFASFWRGWPLTVENVPPANRDVPSVARSVTAAPLSIVGVQAGSGAPLVGSYLARPASPPVNKLEPCTTNARTGLAGPGLNVGSTAPVTA